MMLLQINRHARTLTVFDTLACDAFFREPLGQLAVSVARHGGDAQARVRYLAQHACPKGDHVAAQLADLSKAGLTGIAISLVNYLNELPYFCDEVLPRLERMGLREAH